ncbi:MAG: hypothetical protein ABR909_14160 [Candidatus Bathyarchaeia archaeon]|jgi:hypothetical protein
MEAKQPSLPCSPKTQRRYIQFSCAHKELPQTITSDDTAYHNEAYKTKNIEKLQNDKIKTKSITEAGGEGFEPMPCGRFHPYNLSFF